MAVRTGTSVPMALVSRMAEFSLCGGNRRRPAARMGHRALFLPVAQSGIIALAIAVMSSAAAAAPQILGVVASIAPVEMSCTGETCTAQLSAFCLQRHREVPGEHTAYHAADHRAFTLLARRADGSSVRVPVDGRIGFTSAFGYASVRVSAPARLLAELDASSLAVEVSQAAALVPAPVAGDPDPLGPDEVALATGPLRALASRHFDTPSTERDAAHVIEALVNGFPVQSWDGSVDRAGLWARQVTPALHSAALPEAVALASSVYENCLPSSYSMRQCLELKHMNLLSDANRAYWEEASPGS
jgi:hypothetical protein